MSLNLLNGKVRVYNYEKSPVGFPSSVNKNGNFIPARTEDEENVMVRILWDDIEEENSKCDIFRTGLLRFHPDEEEEIYQKLMIDDKENIMSYQDILKMLTDTSVENLKRINSIKSFSLITRMKMMLFEMEKTQANIPHNVITIINEKYDQFRYNSKNRESSVDKLIKDENKQKEDSKLKDMIKDLANEVKTLKEEKDKTESQSQNALSDLLKMVQDLKAENEKLKEVKNETIVNEEEKAFKTKKSSKKSENVENEN